MTGLPAVLAVDVGLTNCKVIVFSANGQILALASIPYPTNHPRPGYVEQDPEDWWRAICEASQQIWVQQPDLAAQVEAVSVTAHMHALVSIDSAGIPLGRALVLGDQRGAEAAAQIMEEIGLDTIYRITGTRMDASMPAAKIRWLRDTAPDIHRRARAFLGCKDFLRHRMTGDLLTDPIDACAMSLYDIQNGTWSVDMMRASGVDEARLPEVCAPFSIAGSLRAEAARALGLREGVPVVVGGGDDVEVLGNGLMSPSISLEHLGTTGSILVCTGQLLYDPDKALELYPHAVPDLWVVGGSITAAGSALAWASEVTGYGTFASALMTVSQVRQMDVSSLPIFIPHLLGERCPSWDPHARGAWIGLTTSHTRQEMLLSAFEGVAYALKNILDRVQRLTGQENRITVAGHSDDNPMWMKLRASIYGCSLDILNTSEPTALGAMMLAGVGIGLFSTLTEAAEKVTSIRETILPDEQIQELCRPRHEVYTQLQAALRPIWRAFP